MCAYPSVSMGTLRRVCKRRNVSPEEFLTQTRLHVALKEMGATSLLKNINSLHHHLFLPNSQILVVGLSINLKLLWVKGNMQVRVPCRRLLHAYLISTSFLELVSGALQFLRVGYMHILYTLPRICFRCFCLCKRDNHCAVFMHISEPLL